MHKWYTCVETHVSETQTLVNSIISSAYYSFFFDNQAIYNISHLLLVREQDQYSFNGPTVLDPSHHYWIVEEMQFPPLSSIVTTFMMLGSHVKVQHIILCYVYLFYTDHSIQIIHVCGYQGLSLSTDIKPPVCEHTAWLFITSKFTMHAKYTAI